MLRRRRNVFAVDVTSVQSQLLRARFFFGGGGSKAADNNAKDANATTGASSGFFGGAGGLPPGFDVQKMRAMQDMFNSQPPDKQAEMMQKALEFQKMMGKIPGLGKLTQKNVEVMEKLLQNAHHQQQSPQQQKSPLSGKGSVGMFGSGSGAARSAFFQSPSASSGTGGASGPTLDELKRINLGPEIEALFAELKSMRAKKNTYRDKLLAKEEEMDQLQGELTQLRGADQSLRSRLKKVEQDVMLLNSENMELKEHRKEWRQAERRNKELSDTLSRVQHGDAAQYKQRSNTLEDQLGERDDLIRSLQRKLDRLRRRDPLAKFSLMCSDVARLCDAAKDTAKESAEDTFSTLQSSYEEQLDHAWATQSNAAAKAYAAVAHRFFLSRVPHGNLDALVTVEGDVSSLRAAVEAAGMTMEALHEGRYTIAAPKDTSAVGSSGFIGPFALSVALCIAGRAATPMPLLFRVTSASPHVTMSLFRNASRSVVQYESARSSGPGGQASNVAETHITARLVVDGETAFVAEAQDSRSALTNREAATERLQGARRQQYNEHLARQQRAETVARQLATTLAERGGLEVHDAIVEMVRTAHEHGGATAIELGIVWGLRQLAKDATDAASMAVNGGA